MAAFIHPLFGFIGFGVQCLGLKEFRVLRCLGLKAYHILPQRLIVARGGGTELSNYETRAIEEVHVHD